MAEDDGESGGEDGKGPLRAAEIETPKDLERWLESRPREEAAVIAARAALRVAPLIVGILDDDEEERRASILLPLLRALAASWFSSTLPALSEDVAGAAHAAAEVCHVAADTAYSVRAALASKIAYGYVSAAYAAGDAAYAAVTVAASAHAAAAADFAEDAINGRQTHSIGFDVRSDISALEDGLSTQALANQPLWPWDGRNILSTVHDSWVAMRSNLLENENEAEKWWVWTEWYEARLKGAKSAENPDGVAVIRDLERDRVLIEPRLWDEGPKAVNSRIAELIAEYREKDRLSATEASDEPMPDKHPVPPDERPAPIHFEMQGDVVRAMDVSAPDLPGSRADAATRAWQGLTELFEDFAASGGGSQTPRLGATLARCRDALGGRFEALDVVRLGVHAERMQQLAARADEILLAEDAADFVALNAQLGLFLGQFEEWADYQRGLADGFGPAEAEQEAVDLAAKAIAKIEEEAPDLIEEDAAAKIDALRDEAQPEPTAEMPEPIAPPTARRSFLRSARSLFRALSARALQDVDKGVSKGVQKTTESVVVSALSTVGALLVSIATGLPTEFAWLAGVATYIARIHGGSPRSDDRRADDDGPDVMDT